MAKCKLCHREALPNSEYCIFHEDLDKKDPELVLERFKEELLKGERDFSKAKFHKIELQEIPSSFTFIYLGDSQIDGKIHLKSMDLGALDLKNATVNGSVILENIGAGTLKLENTIVKGALEITDSHVTNIDIENSELESLTISLRSNSILSSVTLKKVRVNKQIRVLGQYYSLNLSKVKANGFELANSNITKLTIAYSKFNSFNFDGDWQDITNIELEGIQITDLKGRYLIYSLAYQIINKSVLLTSDVRLESKREKYFYDLMVVKRELRKSHELKDLESSRRKDAILRFFAILKQLREQGQISQTFREKAKLKFENFF